MKIIILVICYILLSISGAGAKEATAIYNDNGKIIGYSSPVYCGEEGGYPKGSHKFEITTRRKGAAALTYSWWAPDQLGIKSCVCEHYPTFPSCRMVNALQQLRVFCWDTWCEGQYNYEFISLVCNGRDRTCDLYFARWPHDQRNKYEKLSCSVKGDYEDFLHIADDEKLQEQLDKCLR